MNLLAYDQLFICKLMFSPRFYIFRLLSEYSRWIKDVEMLILIKKTEVAESLTD